jgi:nuclear transport factor 2 (NTF2) superfamily protein
MTTPSLFTKREVDVEHYRSPSAAATVHARDRYSDTWWRNRAEFVQGREEARAFLERKWSKEFEYRLIKELWAFTDNRIAVRFAYEWRDDAGNWFRSYGNENWEFGPDGLIHHRHASINDLPIKESERKFHWPLGRRPDDHPALSDLGL